MFKDTLQEEGFFLRYYGKLDCRTIMSLSPWARAYLARLVTDRL